MSTSSEGTPTPEASGTRRIWFPLVWVGLFVGACLIFHSSDADQDVKNFVLAISIPLVGIGLSFWFICFSRLSWRARWGLGLAPWFAVLGFVSLVEFVNNGDLGIVGWRWRWATTRDEQLALPTPTSTLDDWQTTPQDYPRFLGNGYWPEIENAELETDWKTNPPEEIWRQEIGAGWSGFSVVSNYAVTQEQRGPRELVTCYDIRTGEIVWTHADPVRFDPSGSGAFGGIGPRATPTIHNQRILTQGATGIVNCLDARTGKLVWSHDTLAEVKASNVMWGKAGSPLVVTREEANDLVVVSVGGTKGHSLMAYDLETGDEVWANGNHRSSYASPVLAKLVGESQILSVNENFVTGHRATDGKILWQHPWPGSSDTDATVSQPVPLTGDRVFLSKGYGIGSSLLHLTATADGKIQATPLWQPAVKRVMKTKMSNVVVRNGYAYGLDGGLMQCIQLETGKSQWKKRRTPSIGHGQILLIGQVILVLTETGELLLVDVSPEKYRELASMRVLPAEQVTWNNPALAPPYLLVRNAEEVACYRLPMR